MIWVFTYCWIYIGKRFLLGFQIGRSESTPARTFLPSLPLLGALKTISKLCSLRLSPCMSKVKLSQQWKQQNWKKVLTWSLQVQNQNCNFCIHVPAGDSQVIVLSAEHDSDMLHATFMNLHRKKGIVLFSKVQINRNNIILQHEMYKKDGCSPLEYESR